MAATVFLTPYQMGKVLNYVQEALIPKRSIFLKSLFGVEDITEATEVNFDKEYGIRNVMGQFVDPMADVNAVQLPDFETKSFNFAYSKEGIVSDGFNQVNQRQMGDQFGQVDINRNIASRLAKKITLVEQRFENLQELVASWILLYGRYQASGEKHSTVRYDFGRTVITTGAKLLSEKIIPSANLTATDVVAPWDSSQIVIPKIPTGGGYTQGQRNWTKANIDNDTATPYKDCVRIYETSSARGGGDMFIMSDDAYDMLNYDLQQNYAEASKTTTLNIMAIQQDYLPRVQQYKGLTFRRTLSLDNGVSVPIYTYNATYHDRQTGVEIPYIGSGWVICTTSPSSNMIIYGRIMHPRANWAAMKRWMNTWTEDKTGIQEWEYHMNFVMAPTQVDAIVSWKVI